MLTAYMDESGHEENRVVLAGFLGNSEQWKLFEKEWQKGLGRRKNLHMRDLRWHKPERIRKLLISLAPIPYQCGLTAIYSTVLASDYSDLIVGTPRQVTSKSWLVALMPLLLRTMQQVPSHERIKFVFDQQTQYEPFTRTMFRVLEEHKTPNGKPRLAGVEFVSRGDTQLTQPGDYLAYAIAQNYRDPISEKSDLCAPIVVALPANSPIAVVLTRELVRYALSYF